MAETMRGTKDFPSAFFFSNYVENNIVLEETVIGSLHLEIAKSCDTITIRKCRLNDATLIVGSFIGGSYWEGYLCCHRSRLFMESRIGCNSV